jgi:hypothetical protein
MITAASDPFNFCTFHTVFPIVFSSDSMIAENDIYQTRRAPPNTVPLEPPLSAH